MYTSIYSISSTTSSNIKNISLRHVFSGTFPLTTDMPKRFVSPYLFEDIKTIILSRMGSHMISMSCLTLQAVDTHQTGPKSGVSNGQQTKGWVGGVNQLNVNHITLITLYTLSLIMWVVILSLSEYGDMSVQVLVIDIVFGCVCM